MGIFFYSRKCAITRANFWNFPKSNGWKRIFMWPKNNKQLNHHPERGNLLLKVIDRYVGIPVLFALGLLRNRKNCGRSISFRNVAFLQTAAIGDTVLSSALVSDLKSSVSDARVTFFTGASNYEIARLIPDVDRVVKLPIKNPREAIKLIRNEGKFDIWIDCGPWPRLNAIYSLFARANLKVGFQTKNQFRHFGYDVVVQHSSLRHEIDNYRALVKAIGVPVTAGLPALTIREENKKSKEIAIHMFPGGSRSYLKEWPDSNWSELIGRLAQDGFDIILTGSAVNRERAVVVRDSVHAKDRVTVVAGADLRTATQMLASSRLVISVDTGVMHIASALGCDLIALHGPTSPSRWGPLNRNAASLSAGKNCSPCLNLGFESRCTEPQCMKEISVDTVYSEVKKFLNI
jgi:heptosyltransferase I